MYTGRFATPRVQRIRRSRAARVIISAAAAMLCLALFRLQVVEGEQNSLAARNNRLRELPIPAPRGTIYDRHGRVVAENVPGFRIQLMPGPQDSMRAQVRRLQPLLGLSEAEIDLAFRRWSRQRHLPLLVQNDAPPDAVAALEERRYLFPGVLVHQYAKRQYPAGPAIAHLVGYVSEISDRELELPEFESYTQGRWIGKRGLERQYEHRLGGTPGKRFLEIDARGSIKRWLPEEIGIPAIPGQDLHLYLDLDLQEYIAETFPKEFDGAVVAMDPRTGGVLAYYSHPTFDPNAFIGGLTTAELQALRTDPRSPQLDRVTNSGQPAASTWKLAVAGMALDLGLVTPDEYMPVSCTGGMSFQNRYSRCHAVHGRQNLIEAIKNSCNVYFYQVGIRIGLRQFLEHGARLGFGRRTGIDVPGERASLWPDIGYWERVYRYRPPENEVMSLAIGQGPMTMTVIKVAHIYAALTAPDGRVPAPRLAQESGAPQDTFEFRTTPRDRWYLEAGMRRVVAPGGTAGMSRLPRWDFMGKTGTAQAPGGASHAWFAGVGAREPGAPPDIAVTMFLARAEHGYTPSGYVAEAINFYMSRMYGEPFVKWASPRLRYAHGLQPLDPLWYTRPVHDPPMPAGASR